MGVEQVRVTQQVVGGTAVDSERKEKLSREEKAHLNNNIGGLVTTT